MTLDAIRARHTPHTPFRRPGAKEVCDFSWNDWPCDTFRAFAEVDRLTALLDDRCPTCGGRPQARCRICGYRWPDMWPDGAA